MSAPSLPSPRALLEHAGWVRALARQLSLGERIPDADPEDLVQDAWVAALERPAAGRSLRRWLGGVVRNRARERVRGHAHRRAREQRAARAEELPSAAELVERMALHRELVEAVTALHEPYRSTLILRFFEELPQSEIARLAGVTTATVNSRLTRALALLRQRLDRRDGGREAWLSALLPLWWSPALETARVLPLAGALTMSKTILLATGAAATAGLLALLLRGAGEAVPVQGARPDPRMEASLAASESTPPLLAPLRHEAPGVSTSTTNGGPPPAPPPTADLVAGRVIDVDGLPVPGALVVTEPALEGAATPLLSDAEGRFTLPAGSADQLVWVHARRAGYAEVSAGLLFEDTRSVDLVLAPAISARGRVVDAAGEPVAGASVRFSPGEAWRANLDEAPASTREAWIETTTDDGGRFRFDELPLVEAARLHAINGRYRSRGVSLTVQDSQDLLLTLQSETFEGDLLRGKVVDARGAPVEEAWIACGHAGAVSAADGTVALERMDIEAGEPILAAKQGLLPARLEPMAAKGAEDSGWPETIELRLGGPALSISGVVLDSDGRPLRHSEVWITNPTVFGPADGWLSHLEALLAGEKGSTTFVTDGQGRFRLEGLVDKRYDLAASDLGTLRVARATDVLAGSEGVVLRLPEPEEGNALTGVVVDGSGRPMADVQLMAGRLVRSWTWPGDDPAPSGESLFGPQARTDSRGRFRIEGVPPEADRIRLQGEALLPSEQSIPPTADRSALVLVVEGRRLLQVEAGRRWAAAKDFQVLDSEGRPLSLYVFNGQGYSRSSSGHLYEGRSPVLALSEHARTVVLRGERREELQRMDVELGTTGVTLVRID